MPEHPTHLSLVATSARTHERDAGLVLDRHLFSPTSGGRVSTLALLPESLHKSAGAEEANPLILEAKLI
jgi:hypothetical protein